MLKEQRAWTDALERRLGRKVQWVFHRDGKRMMGFRKAWITACKRALLVGMIPHDLRRTAVLNLERAGVSRSVAMKLTGHKTEAIYRRYAEFSHSMCPHCYETKLAPQPGGSTGYGEQGTVGDHRARRVDATAGNGQGRN